MTRTSTRTNRGPADRLPLARSAAVVALRESALDQTPISNPSLRALSPHTYYRYPARFTPRFAAAAMELVSDPGSLVLDPFVGGGTTLIEAMRHGRRAVGVDISPISVFVARTTSTLYRASELEVARDWLAARIIAIQESEFGRPLSGDFPTVHLDVQRNWRVLKIIDRLLETVGELPPRPQAIVRLVLLRSSQWAFDHRQRAPGLREFLSHLTSTMVDAVSVLLGFGAMVREEWGPGYRESYHRVLSGDAARVLPSSRTKSQELFDAVVTSPPYPGVHMLYGRWQVNGRRETPLPIRIIGSTEELREGDYTLHARREPDCRSYFDRLNTIMSAIRPRVRDGAWSVQMVGFSDPASQLTQYLRAMRRNGFEEVRSRRLANDADGRLWRDVPGRRWYATRNGDGVATRREVVLLFKAV